jgi:hypothetical protein
MAGQFELMSLHVQMTDSWLTKVKEVPMCLTEFAFISDIFISFSDYFFYVSRELCIYGWVFLPLPRPCIYYSKEDEQHCEQLASFSMNDHVDICNESAKQTKDAENVQSDRRPTGYYRRISQTDPRTNTGLCHLNHE